MFQFEYFFTTPTADAEDEDDDNDEDGDHAVVSLLEDDSVIESGVTSGADPSDWDPIDIDKKP